MRDANTYTFELDATRLRADRPNEPQRVFGGRGAVDVRARSGRMDLDLSPLFAGLPRGEDDENPLSEPIRLRWDAKTLFGETSEGKGSAPRARARESGGLLGRVPDEVQGLVRLLEEGTNVRRGGTADTVVFAVPIGRASVAGAPAELVAEAARRLLGPRLDMMTALDDDGRPTRISYTYRLKPTRNPDTGRVGLPARSVTVVYRLTDLGEDVDVGAPGQSG